MKYRSLTLPARSMERQRHAILKTNWYYKAANGKTLFLNCGMDERTWGEIRRGGDVHRRGHGGSGAV